MLDLRRCALQTQQIEQLARHLSALSSLSILDLSDQGEPWDGVAPPQKESSELLSQLRALVL